MALHTAAASFAGPGTWLLVGIAPAGTPGRRWSSADVPLPSVSKAGSMKLTFGRLPAAHVSMNDGVASGIPTASTSPSANGCQNGKYFVARRARNGRSRKK